ncbi:hypothetical protein MTO96_030539 [Rhipicephalus appendiculatus]
MHREKCLGLKAAAFIIYADEELSTKNNHNIPEVLTGGCVYRMSVANVRFYKTLTNKNINRLPMNVKSCYQQVHARAMALCHLFLWREKATCSFCEESSLSMHVAKVITPYVTVLRTVFLRSAKSNRNRTNNACTLQD